MYSLRDVYVARSTCFIANLFSARPPCAWQYACLAELTTRRFSCFYRLTLNHYRVQCSVATILLRNLEKVSVPRKHMRRTLKT